MDRGVGENLCESALAPPRAPELLFVRTRDRASKNLRIAEAPSSLPDRTVIRPIHPSCRRSFPFYLDVRLIPSLVSLSPPLSFPFAIMAWQSPNCVLQAMQSVRRSAAPWRSSLLRPSKTPTYPITRTAVPSLSQQQRTYATEVQAAPEIDFATFQAQPARIVPRSRSYFSGSPKFIDNILSLERLLAQNLALPTVPANEAPRKAWLKLAQFRDYVGEPVATKKYKNMLKLLQRLNRIDPAVVPVEVTTMLEEFLRPGNPYSFQPAPPTVDEMGRARGRGKRKASSAVATVVEGEGEVMVNGKTLAEAFPRIHDRESATWALRSSSRLDKYNVWATVRGGGTTGQAEAVTLAVGRALMVHEPGLKPILRKGMYLISPGLSMLANWIFFLQPALSRWMHDAWKGRSPVISRRARCPPGSSGEDISSGFLSFLCTFFPISFPSSRRHLLQAVLLFPT